MAKNERNCNECLFAFLVDYGYSNYTTEGTYFHCGINKHPLGSFDRFYGKDDRLNHAKKCRSYAKGTPVEICVDRDCGFEQRMTPAQVIMWCERVSKL